MKPPAFFIDRLIASNVRNLRSVAIDLHPRVNRFVGANGSGKTSLLEAVHLLGTGRPFRGSRVDPVISYEAPSLLVRGRLVRDGKPSGLGVERDRTGVIRARRDGQDVRTAAALAEQLPLVVLHPGTVAIVSGAPAIRRRQLDWGLFHADPTFASSWGAWRRVLAQRNAAVRRGAEREIALWDRSFVEAAEALHARRSEYVSALLPGFAIAMQDLQVEGAATVELSAGWDVDKGLAEVLVRSMARDRMLGYCTRGPHRSDLRLLRDGRPAADALSRGEQKLFAYGMLLAQARLGANKRSFEPVALIDDLSAELDAARARAAFNAFDGLGGQVWLTGVEPAAMERLSGAAVGRTFHVEQGTVREAR